MVILCLIVLRDCQSVLQNDYKSSKNARRFHFLYITVSMCCYVFFIWSLILQRTYENTRLNYYSQLFFSKVLQEFHNIHFLTSSKNCLVITQQTSRTALLKNLRLILHCFKKVIKLSCYLEGSSLRQMPFLGKKKIKHKPITKPPQIHRENYRPHQQGLKLW